MKRPHLLSVLVASPALTSPVVSFGGISHHPAPAATLLFGARRNRPPLPPSSALPASRLGPLLLSTKAKASYIEITADQQSERTVTILEQGAKYLVAAKPPSVVCHHSGWTGSRSRAKRGEEPEIPMLQRVRDGISSLTAKSDDDIGGNGDGTRRVNVVHRLDRGASGCLLFAFADEDDSKRSSTAILQEAMASSNATKTYLALVRGEGILRGDDLKARGWFLVEREIKDEQGRLNNATTWFRFVAGQSHDEDNDRPRASLVLARPVSGRWHQVRRHLNGLSHPILGDTSHGASQTNREWKERRNMPGERTCLHLARMQLPPNEVAPEGIDVCCPLEGDMMQMMQIHMPKVLEEAEPILQ